MGGVQFVLTSPATFTVTITGEVNSTTEKNAWALTDFQLFFLLVLQSILQWVHNY